MSSLLRNSTLNSILPVSYCGPDFQGQCSGECPRSRTLGQGLEPCKISSSQMLLGSKTCTIAAKIITNITFQKNCFGTINFVKITKQSLYKANSFACSLANRDKPVAAALQRECSGGIIFVIITKIITKIIVRRNYFVFFRPGW